MRSLHELTSSPAKEVQFRQHRRLGFEGLKWIGLRSLHPRLEALVFTLGLMPSRYPLIHPAFEIYLSSSRQFFGLEMRGLGRPLKSNFSRMMPVICYSNRGQEWYLDGYHVVHTVQRLLDIMADCTCLVRDPIFWSNRPVATLAIFKHHEGLLQCYPFPF